MPGKALRSERNGSEVMAEIDHSDHIEKPSLTAHVKTYDGVIALFKWGSVATAVVAARPVPKRTVIPSNRSSLMRRPPRCRVPAR